MSSDGGVLVIMTCYDKYFGTHFTGTYLYDTSWYYMKVYCTKVQYFVKYQNTRFRDPTGIVRGGLSAF